MMSLERSVLNAPLNFVPGHRMALPGIASNLLVFREICERGRQCQEDTGESESVARAKERAERQALEERRDKRKRDAGRLRMEVDG
jgi:hypothetical protein